MRRLFLQIVVLLGFAACTSEGPKGGSPQTPVSGPASVGEEGLIELPSQASKFTIGEYSGGIALVSPTRIAVTMLGLDVGSAGQVSGYVTLDRATSSSLIPSSDFKTLIAELDQQVRPPIEVVLTLHLSGKKPVKKDIRTTLHKIISIPGLSNSSENNSVAATRIALGQWQVMPFLRSEHEVQFAVVPNVPTPQLWGTITISKDETVSSASILRRPATHYLWAANLPNTIKPPAKAVVKLYADPDHSAVSEVTFDKIIPVGRSVFSKPAITEDAPKITTAGMAIMLEGQDQPVYFGVEGRNLADALLIVKAGEMEHILPLDMQSSSALAIFDPEVGMGRLAPGTYSPVVRNAAGEVGVPAPLTKR